MHKSVAKKNSRKTTSTFVVGEHIRVVPVYQPKPSVAIDALKELAVTAPTPKLVYGGGALLQNVQVFTIFWGKTWGASAASTQLIDSLNQFFLAVVVGPVIDQLAEYNFGPQKIGHGSVVGTKTIKANAPSGSVTDLTIQQQLKAWIASKTVPAATKNTLYFIYLDPGVVSIMGGSRSCQSYCGYHSNSGALYYAVMPYPSCSGCRGGLQTFDALTGTSSHELCEAITDPVPGSGWYENAHGEIGDICAWNFKKVAGYNVQLEWSNKQQKCV